MDIKKTGTQVSEPIKKVETNSNPTLNTNEDIADLRRILAENKEKKEKLERELLSLKKRVWTEPDPELGNFLALKYDKLKEQFLELANKVFSMQQKLAQLEPPKKSKRKKM